MRRINILRRVFFFFADVDSTLYWYYTLWYWVLGK